jgi:uncharacterized protein (UPF0333 family)
MKKHKKLIIILIVIVVLAIIGIFFAIKSTKQKDLSKPQNGEMPQFSDMEMNENGFENQGKKDDDDIENNENMENKKDIKVQNTTTLKTTAEVSSALTENIELHATYYLEEIYVEQYDFVEAGENILKYTNGTYLVAPYDCYIIRLNLPDLEGKALNSHYVEISSSNSLMVIMSVDETNISKVSVGQEATIEVTALGKTYTGYVTHVASTGSNGKFEIEIEFENDGDIKLGMTSTVSITI